MEINLEPRYRNYWLDVARKEKKDQEEEKRTQAVKNLLRAINNSYNMNIKKP